MSNDHAKTATGHIASPVWEAAAANRKPKTKRGGRGQSRGHKPDVQRREEVMENLIEQHFRVVHETKPTRKLAMMGRAAALWMPKNSEGQPARFLKAGEAKMLYMEPVYEPGQPGFIERIDLMQVSARMNYENQSVTYNSASCWDLWLPPQGRTAMRNKGAIDLCHDNQIALLRLSFKLFQDLRDSCDTQPADRSLAMIEETDDDVPSKDIGQRRVLPNLVVGFHERPVFDPNNVAPKYADDLEVARGFFESSVVEPMKGTNKTPLFYVPLGLYAKWPSIPSIYGPKYDIYEDFGNVLATALTSRGRPWHYIEPLILWSSTTRADATYRLNVGDVPMILDLKPRDYAGPAFVPPVAGGAAADAVATSLAAQTGE